MTNENEASKPLFREYFKYLGKSGTVSVLAAMYPLEKKGFKELEPFIGSSKMLSGMLKEGIKKGLVLKRIDAKKTPPRSWYYLTIKGRMLVRFAIDVRSEMEE